MFRRLALVTVFVLLAGTAQAQWPVGMPFGAGNNFAGGYGATFPGFRPWGLAGNYPSFGYPSFGYPLVGPFGFGNGGFYSTFPYGPSGPGDLNPLFGLGTTPLAVQSALNEGTIRRFQVGQTMTMPASGNRTYTYKIVSETPR
jgi:hypothetical protein